MRSLRSLDPLYPSRSSLLTRFISAQQLTCPDQSHDLRETVNASKPEMTAAKVTNLLSDRGIPFCCRSRVQAAMEGTSSMVFFDRVSRRQLALIAHARIGKSSSARRVLKSSSRADIHASRRPYRCSYPTAERAHARAFSLAHFVIVNKTALSLSLAHIPTSFHSTSHAPSQLLRPRY
jgi:hypothetical protein